MTTSIQQWTQDEAIAFECACEVITNLMALCSSMIAAEVKKNTIDTALQADLRATRSRLMHERSTLHLSDQAELATIRRKYGRIIRDIRHNHTAHQRRVVRPNADAA